MWWRWLLLDFPFELCGFCLRDLAKTAQLLTILLALSIRFSSKLNKSKTNVNKTNLTMGVEIINKLYSIREFNKNYQIIIQYFKYEFIIIEIHWMIKFNKIISRIYSYTNNIWFSILNFRMNSIIIQVNLKIYPLIFRSNSDTISENNW